jgi:hypothetical protein
MEDWKDGMMGNKALRAFEPHPSNLPSFHHSILPTLLFAHALIVD